MTSFGFGHEQKPGKVYMINGDKMLPMPETAVNLNEVIKPGVKDEPLLDPEKMGGPIVLSSGTNLLASTFVTAADTILDFAIALTRAIPKNLNAARKKMKSLIKLKYGKSFRSAKKAIAYYDRLKAREKQLEEKEYDT